MEKTNRKKALSSHAKPEDTQNIETYLDQMKLDDPVPVEEFRKIARALIGARGLFLYFVWQVLKEKGLDADALVQEASHRLCQRDLLRLISFGRVPCMSYTSVRWYDPLCFSYYSVLRKTFYSRHNTRFDLSHRL